jgi:hypothetical protein
VIQLKSDASEKSPIGADLNQAFVSGCPVTVNVNIVVVVLVVAFVWASSRYTVDLCQETVDVG